MVVTTLLLMLGVGLGTLVIGAGLGWLVTTYAFPGRDTFVWLLVLPLAMPAYILGFVFLSTFDEAGPVQQALRAVLGEGAGVSVRTLAGCVVVMSLTLYPYVYLLARAAFVEQGSRTRDAARTLGAGRRRTFFRVLLPLARPSLAAGLALVMMEVLTDFATVQYFGVRTVSVGVYSVWKGTYDFGSAVQLSTLVLLFAVAVLAGERLMRGRARYTQPGRGPVSPRIRLHGWRAGLATAACLLTLGAGFFVPVGRLAGWAVQRIAVDGLDSVDAPLRRVPHQLRRRRRDRRRHLLCPRGARRPRGQARRRPRGAGLRGAHDVRVRRPRRRDRHRDAAAVLRRSTTCSRRSGSPAAPACW